MNVLHRASLPLVVLAVAACSGATEPVASDTGVLAQVRLWPVDPVEIEGQPSRTRPATGARVVVRDGRGRRIAEMVTAENGSARILVQPGSYVVAVVECPGAMSLPKEDVEVIVTRGSFAGADLTCDTGIR